MEDKQRIRFLISIILFISLSIELFMNKRDTFTYILLGGLSLEIILYIVIRKYHKFHLLLTVLTVLLFIALVVYVARIFI